MTARLKWVLVAVMALAVLGLAAACGDDDDSDATPVATEGTEHDDDTTADVAFGMDAATEALTAIHDGHLDDARHHVEQVIASVDDESHVEAMREVLAELDANDTSAAELGIEAMIAGRAESALDAQVLHLQVALDLLEAGDTEGATEHVGHFTDLAGESDEAQEVLGFIERGDHDEAAEHLSELVLALAEDSDHTDDDHAVDTVLAADREVTVVMTEFAYEPNVIRAKVGERVRLVLHNEGVVLHDITAEEFHGHVETTAAVESHASDAGDDHAAGGGFHAALNGGDTAELVFEADEAGEFELFCTVPGHRDLGMTATLIVEE